MTTSRESPTATALWKARGRAPSLLKSYTTNGGTTCGGKQITTYPDLVERVAQRAITPSYLVRLG